MKEFLKNLVKRVGDLIIKLISVKGLFAIGMTLLALLTNGGLIYAFIAWAVLIGGREVGKWRDKMFAAETPVGGV
jgi:hypothetical protein